MSISDGRFDFGGGLAVGPGLTERALRACRPDAMPLVHNGPWRSWRLSPMIFESRRVIADVYFVDGRLWQLHLYLTDLQAEGEDWPDLDEEQAAHAAFLEALLGPPPYDFAWGRIEASADPRSGSASIIVGFGPNPLR